MGFGYRALVANSVPAFIFLYCLTNFFQNFGPNTTTFIVPGEIFPTRYRSTAHGLSAAAGKFGAIIAQIMAFQLKDMGGRNQFVEHLLVRLLSFSTFYISVADSSTQEIFALFMLTGIFSTLLIPETAVRSANTSLFRR